MPTSPFSSEVQELAVDTAWSLWTELGVNGSVRHHSDVGVDLEALILATAYLGQTRRAPPCGVARLVCREQPIRIE